jgi:hypothetical protein
METAYNRMSIERQVQEFLAGVKSRMRQGSHVRWKALLAGAGPSMLRHGAGARVSGQDGMCHANERGLPGTMRNAPRRYCSYAG